ncbi:MAG: rhamnan synthesis F family protein [Sulfobacillus sp.]
MKFRQKAPKKLPPPRMVAKSRTENFSRRADSFPGTETLSGFERTWRAVPTTRTLRGAPLVPRQARPLAYRPWVDYVVRYPEVVQDEHAAIEHYRVVGSKESRLWRDAPAWKRYGESVPFVGEFPGEREARIHWMTVGKDVGMTWPSDYRIAVVLHAFNLKVAAEMLPLIGNVRQAGYVFNFFVNVVENGEPARKFAEQVKKSYPNSTVVFSANLGRDIGGFFHAMKALMPRISDFHFVLFLHTKTADVWRRDLLRATLETPSVVYHCIESLATDLSIGVIGTKNWLRTMKNSPCRQDLLDLICRKTGVRPPTNFEFIGGTFFWTRASLLAKYFGPLDLDSCIKEFSQYGEGAQPGGPLGTLEHAYERFFGLISNIDGLSVATL